MTRHLFYHIVVNVDLVAVTKCKKPCRRVVYNTIPRKDLTLLHHEPESAFIYAFYEDTQYVTPNFLTWALSNLFLFQLSSLRGIRENAYFLDWLISLSALSSSTI